MRENSNKINKIFEDFIETLETDDIIQSEDLVKTEETSERPVQSYQHFVEFYLIPVSMLNHNDMLPGGVKILQKRAFPILRRADKYMTEYKPVWYALNVPDEGPWEFSRYMEYFDYQMENNLSYNSYGFLRIYFDTVDNLSVYGSLNILRAFTEMAQQIFNMITTLNNGYRYFSLDGFNKYEFGDTTDLESIANKCYTDNKSRMRIKFWVKRLCGDDTKTKKIINSMISTEDDYMGSKKAFNNASAKFKKNMRDAVLMPYKDDMLLCIIPEGKTVTVRSGNPQYDTPMEFRIDGTLIMVHNMSKDDRYRQNSNWDTLQLDPEYEHNHFCCKCNYSELPGKTSNTIIDIGERHIRRLDIIGNEIIFQSEDALKKVVELRRTDNVEEINWIIEEVENYED